LSFEWLLDCAGAGAGLFCAGSSAVVGGAVAFGAELLLLLACAGGLLGLAGAACAAGCGAGLLACAGGLLGFAGAACGAGLLPPLFVLLLSPSPLPPIWWSLWWAGLSWR
jgi:hypothetical protein